MKVSRREGFSDRNGIKPENTLIQIKEFDNRTRIQLQNMINNLYVEIYKNVVSWKSKEVQDFIKYVYSNIYSQHIDNRKIYNDDKFFDIIDKTLMEDDYDDILTLIEGIVEYWDSYLKKVYPYNYYSNSAGYYKESIFETVNNVFCREYIGYRFIDGKLFPISNQYEIDTITEALSSKHTPIYQHIIKANKLLSDRKNPDYENSIKESISAVEAICMIITENTGSEATLGKMLKKLKEKGVYINKALQAAFSSLYGYTSDANGIRHARGIGGKESTFQEAKFMMVSCCAFINYLLDLVAD